MHQGLGKSALAAGGWSRETCPGLLLTARPYLASPHPLPTHSAPVGPVPRPRSMPLPQPSKQKRKFSSFFKSLVIELDKDLYGPDNHLVEVRKTQTPPAIELATDHGPEEPRMQSC